MFNINIIDHKHFKSSPNNGKEMILAGISLRGLTVTAEHAGEKNILRSTFVLAMTPYSLCTQPG